MRSENYNFHKTEFESTLGYATQSNSSSLTVHVGNFSWSFSYLVNLEINLHSHFTSLEKKKDPSLGVVKCRIQIHPFCHKSSAFFLRFGGSILKDAFLTICSGGVYGGTVESPNYWQHDLLKTQYKYVSRICLLYCACLLLNLHWYPL